jgi:hypothetical protein
MKKWVNKLINFTKRLTMPEMKSPGIELSRKHINSGYRQLIIPKHHGCTIEIVSFNSIHDGQNKNNKHMVN